MWSNKELDEEIMRPAGVQDWRQAIRMPTAYRVGNSTLRLQTHFVAAVVVVGIACLVLLYTLLPINHKSHSSLLSDLNRHGEEDHIHTEEAAVRGGEGVPCKAEGRAYNHTFPLTKPELLGNGAIKYRIGIISDLDTASKSTVRDNIWISYYLKGWLTLNLDSKKASVVWDDQPVTLKYNLASGGRGMELSELVVFDGRLLTVDDRTGTVYEIIEDRVVPWLILADGNGRSSKGFKGEWATVRGEQLFIGGLGKEWTNNKGEILNYDPQWVKRVSHTGEVAHQEWRDHYLSLMIAAGIKHPGYMIHEAVCWSPAQSKWFFLPRRASNLKYNDRDDEKRGTNFLLRTDNSFKNIQAMTVGPLLPTHGFSSFKFVPGTMDKVILALKSEENKDKVSTFVTIITTAGEVWLPEQEIGNFKYEGVEFI